MNLENAQMLVYTIIQEMKNSPYQEHLKTGTER